MRLLLLIAFFAVAGTAFAAKPRPDLKVTKVTGPSAPVSPGSFFSVRAVIRNAGKAKAKKSVTGFFLELPNDAQRNVGSVVTKKFRKGQKRTIIGLLTVPDDLRDGSYRLIACADNTKKVRERKEANNCRAAKDPVTVSSYATR
jgi:hypothetical protein